MVSILLSFALLILFTNEAKAIVVLVPVVLIPIVKILAVIIGAFAVPVVSLSTFFYKIKKKSPIAGMLIGIVLLILLGIIVILILKTVNPQRQLY